MPFSFAAGLVEGDGGGVMEGTPPEPARDTARVLPGPTPWQRHPRNALRRHLLPATNRGPDTRAGHPCDLTRNIGTPPGETAILNA